MQFSQELDTGSYVIRSYAPGAVVITEPLTADTIVGWPGADAPVGELLKRRTLARSAVVTPQRLLEDWPINDVDKLQPSDLDAILALGPEVLLLGTGKSLRWPADDVLQALQERGTGFEVMDTAAACRTYNILVLEGRHVAAALII